MVKDLFKKALKAMLEDGEFPKLINSAPNSGERKRIAHDFDILLGLSEKTDIEEFPWIPMVRELKSVEVFKDAISYMAMIENKLLKGEKNDESI